MNRLYISDYAVPFAAACAMNKVIGSIGTGAIVINGAHPTIQRDIAYALQQLLDSQYFVLDLFAILPMLGINRQTGKQFSSLRQAVTLQPDITTTIIEQFHTLAVELIRNDQPIIICHELWHHPLYRKFVQHIEQRNALTINIAHNQVVNHSFNLTLDPYVHSAAESSFIIYQAIVQ